MWCSWSVMQLQEMSVWHMYLQKWKNSTLHWILGWYIWMSWLSLFFFHSQVPSVFVQISELLYKTSFFFSVWASSSNWSYFWINTVVSYWHKHALCLCEDLMCFYGWTMDLLWLAFLISHSIPFKGDAVVWITRDCIAESLGNIMHKNMKKYEYQVIAVYNVPFFFAFQERSCECWGTTRMASGVKSVRRMARVGYPVTTSPLWTVWKSTAGIMGPCPAAPLSTCSAAWSTAAS